MGISKVEFGGEVLIDLTNDTNTAATTLAGYTGHGADGEPFSGNVDLSVYATTAYVDGQVATRATRKIYNAVLNSNWNEETIPYTQTIIVDGLLSSDTPHITPIYSDNSEVVLDEQKSWGFISRAKSNDGSITFFCFYDVPTIPLNIQIEVIR